MTDPPSVSELQEELTDYYAPLLPYWDASLASRGDLAFWRQRAAGWSEATVLELGCGNGRVTEVLARHAGRVVGLDLNLEALRSARRRLGPGSGVGLVAADMRTFAFARPFPVVVAANDPFSHLRSDRGRREALGRVAAHLEPGGRLLLDALWFPDSWLEDARSQEGKTLEHEPGDRSEVAEVRIRHRWRCPPDGRICTARFEVWVDGERRADATFRGRAWSVEELRGRLAAAGLRVDRFHGDYGGGEWHPEAERLVVEAVRG